MNTKIKQQETGERELSLFPATTSFFQITCSFFRVSFTCASSILSESLKQTDFV